MHSLSNRGGFRVGSGRKFQGETVVKRINKDLFDQLDYLQALDGLVQQYRLESLDTTSPRYDIMKRFLSEVDEIG